MKKRLFALALSGAMLIGLLAGCGGGGTSGTPAPGTAAPETGAPETTAPAADGSVYYLNFKPEQDEQWQALAEAYTAETGRARHRGYRGVRSIRDPTDG